MPLQLPNLDDRTYDDLVAEALSLIPTYAPDWTNHNPSDPGITLIELFAYLTEILIYRLNRVTNANRQTFLNLISGVNPDGSKKYPTPLDEKTLNEEIRRAVLALRTSDRAVTIADFERLAIAASPQQVARARCVPRRDLESEDPKLPPVDCPGHVSLVILPKITPLLITSDGVNNTDQIGWIDAPTQALPLLPNSGQFLYVGSNEPLFQRILFRFQQPGLNYTLRFEYFDGTQWMPLTPANAQLQDGTNQWTVSGTVQFNPPPNWAIASIPITAAPQPRNGYWVRLSTTTLPSRTAQVAQIVPAAARPGDSLIQTVLQYLEERLLLTTKAHVVGATYVQIGVKITLVLKPDAKEDGVLDQAIVALWNFFDPIVGGSDGQGWSFGRDVFVSEIYELLDKLPGVDYVTRTIQNPGTPQQKELDEITVNDRDRRRPSNSSLPLAAIKVNANELVNATINAADIEIVTPVKPLFVSGNP